MSQEVEKNIDIQAAKKTTRNKPKQDKKEKRIYVGPTIPGLAKNTILTSVSREIESLVKENPIILNLLVPIAEYTKVQGEIRSGEGPAAKYFNKIKEDINNGI